MENSRRPWLNVTALALVVAVFAACGYPEYSGFDRDPAQEDASSLDAQLTPDSALDAPPDNTQHDAPPDATPDADPDADPDAKPDAPPDAPPDVTDAPTDSVDEVDGPQEADAPDGWACTANVDCATHPDGSLCHLASGRCGDCLPEDDTCPTGRYCSAGSLKCAFGCKGDGDCVVKSEEDAGLPDDDAGDADGSSGALTCDLATHQCVGCAVDEECPLGSVCDNAACVQGCTTSQPCPPGMGCCSGSCQDISSDLKHCGSCNVECPVAPKAAVVCETGKCIIAGCDTDFADCNGTLADGCEADLSGNLQHCGACGIQCAPANATGQCVGGNCYVTQCAQGFADCDQEPANGCEVTTVTDKQNCGSCSNVCPLLAHALPACSGSTCIIGSCDVGYADCNATVSDGCETPLLSNTNNCGGCGISCSLLNASAVCVDGACTVASCIQPFGNCDLLHSNGCEANLSVDPDNCGNCGNVCSYDHALALCNSNTCGLGACAAGWGNCDASSNNGCESPLMSDPQNCGNCGNTCTAPRATTACNSTACEIVSCNTPFGDCNTNYSDGCETDLSSNVNHCSICGKVCSFPNGVPSCTSGQCALTGCAIGFDDCDAQAGNGCEANLQSNIYHCGGCGITCSSNHGTPSCVGGQCKIACSPGFSDCNNDPADGCETAITNNVDACGSCSIKCSAANGTAACDGSACTIESCKTSWGDCDGLYSTGCETALTSNSNCGVCGEQCAPPNATGTCTSGACQVNSCNSGYENCDGSHANGCEVNKVTDVLNCGSCSNVCSIAGCEEVCSAGACGCSTCTVAGTADCDGLSANGCETNTTTDVGNCGACGQSCTVPNGTPACVNSTCQVAGCLTGYDDCNNQPGDGCEASLKTNTNCGACGVTCSLAHATSSCSTGSCVISACEAGWTNCDGNHANGCEVNTASDPTRCGSCTTACSTNNGTASCTGGACSITCAAGFSNCDSDVSNGCETNTSTNIENCGSCGAACNTTNGTASCTASTCGITCSAGYGNCDNNAGNGCETETTSNLSNCGTCGNVCSSVNGVASCSTGTCGIVCNAGFGNCDGAGSNGCEAAFATDVNNCGSCNLVCDLPNATPACASGSCAIGSCNAGYRNCDALTSNGCEKNTDSDPLNCGACGNVCSSINGTASCTAGACQITCSAGYGDCDSNVSNGCETATSSSLTHCGTCGNACPAVPNGTASCLSGTCGIASCNAGYHVLGGQCVPDAENCTNGVDDDGDGRTDCHDSDCLTEPNCAGICMAAATIGCDSYATNQSTTAIGATTRIAPPAYSCTTTSFSGSEYAYRFNGATGGNVFAEVYGLSGNAGLFVVDVAAGAQCDAATSCSKFSNISADPLPEAVGFSPAVGRDYYIIVDAASAVSYSLAVQCTTAAGCFPAVGIELGESIQASNAMGGVNVTNALTTYSCIGWSETGPEAAFIFTPTASGNYKVNLTGLGADLDLFVLNADNCDGTCHSSTSRSVNQQKQNESLTFAAVANKSYFIVVDGYGGNVSNFTLSVVTP